jgi:hypothetical protein
LQSVINNWSTFEWLSIGVGGHATGELFWDDGESLVDDLDNYNYYRWTFDYSQTTRDAQLAVRQVRMATVSN